MKHLEWVWLKKCWGFNMHFGHVETSRVSTILIHHTGHGFDTVAEALEDLAHYLLEEYLNGTTEEQANAQKLSWFIEYIWDLPTNVASGSPLNNTYGFDLVHANDEQWWPWDSLKEVAENLHFIYESTEPMDKVLPYFLNPDRVSSGNLKNEIIQLRNGTTINYADTFEAISP